VAEADMDDKAVETAQGAGGGTKAFSRQRLQRLMALAAQMRVPTAEPPACEDFDWFKPHHFRREELARYELVARRIEKHIAAACETLFRIPCEVSASEYEQHYADRLARHVREEQQDFYTLPLDLGQMERNGYVSLSQTTAMVLVGLMLRDLEFASGDVRPLTVLEESILMDALAALSDAVGRGLHESGGPAVRKGTRFVKGDWPLAFEGLEDLFNIRVAITAETDAIELDFVMLASLLDPVLGVAAPNREGSVQELRERIMRNAEAVPVQIEARLAEATISLHDVMTLRAGDVVVLNKKITEPLDLVLNGRRCFYGYPARTSNHLAVVVVPPQGS